MTQQQTQRMEQHQDQQTRRMSQQETSRIGSRRSGDSNLTQEEQEGVLSRVSLPAVFASTLTAVTSFLFSSRLGLAGSLIGAALAAAVSTVASQVYTAMIDKSAEKLHDFSDQVLMRTSADEVAAIDTIDVTQVRPVPAELQDVQATEIVTSTGTPVATDAYREEADRRRARSLKVRTIAVVTAIAFAALLTYGLIVNAATQGQGIGPTSFAQVEETVSQQTEAEQKDSSEGDEKVDEVGQNAESDESASSTTSSTAPVADDSAATSTDEGTDSSMPSTVPDDSATADTAPEAPSDDRNAPFGDGDADSPSATSEGETSEGKQPETTGQEAEGSAEAQG